MKTCEYNQNKTAFISIAAILAGVYAFSMFYLGAFVKENTNLSAAEQIPNCPASANNVFKNFPFRRFLFPALLDTAIVYILFPFLPFFVEYILDPVSACQRTKESTDKLKCRSTYWVGFIVVSYIAGIFLSQPIWIAGLKKLQIKVAWGLSSFCLTIMLPILAACKDDYNIIAMILFFFIGIAQGGAFIQKSMLGDIIEYEELIQCRRMEGTFVG